MAVQSKDPTAIGMIGIGLIVRLLAGCEQHEKTADILSEHVTLGPDWRVRSLPERAKAESDWEQEVLITPCQRYEKVVEPEIRLKIGASEFWPDVDMEEADGHWVAFSSRGYYGDDLSASRDARARGGARYVAIRLRSAEPLCVSHVVWHAYDPSVIKR